MDNYERFVNAASYTAGAVIALFCSVNTRPYDEGTINFAGKNKENVLEPFVRYR